MKKKRLLVLMTVMMSLITVLILAFTVTYVLNTDIDDSEASVDPNAADIVESCYKWDFSDKANNTQVTSLTSPSLGGQPPVTLTLSHNINTEDYGGNYSEITNIKVIDPYNSINSESDFQVGLGKMLILDDPGSNANDSFKGGDFIFTLSGGTVHKIKFTTVDMGDEAATNAGNPATDRIDHHYYKVIKTNNQSDTANMGWGGGGTLPDKYVWDHETMTYYPGIKTFTVHMSGSGAIDNFEICNVPPPTNTPTRTVVPTASAIPVSSPTPSPAITPIPIMTPTPTFVGGITPTVTATPPSTAMECVGTNTVKYFNRELLVANATEASKSKNADSKGSLPAGVTLVNKTTHNIDLANSAIFIDDPLELRYKYAVKIQPMWGWRGTNGQMTEKTEQKTENHVINALKVVKSSGKTTTLFGLNCLDWGNAKGKTDGLNPLLSVENVSDIVSSKFFRACINSFNANGVPRVPAEQEVLVSKGEAVKVEATHKTTQQEFQDCLAENNNSKPKCQGSHYSMVKVTYCVEEGEAE